MLKSAGLSVRSCMLFAPTMDTLQTNRCEIPLGAGMRTLYVVVGMIFLAVGIVGAYALIRSQPSSLGGFAFLAFVAVGIYMLALAFRSRVVLDGPNITVIGPFKERSAKRDEIAGLRTISSRNGSYWILQLRDSRPSITLQKSFDCDDLREWLGHLPDLDERDRQQVLDEIGANPELGATPEDRLSALKRALWVNIALTAAAILAALGFAFAPEPYRSLGAPFIAVIPLVIIYLVRTAPLLYAILKQRRDPRTDLSFAFMACAFGLYIGMLQIHLVSFTRLLPWIVVVAVACLLALLSAIKNRTQMIGTAIGLLVFVGVYAYGLTAAANSLLDRAAPTRYPTTVTGMHVSHGKSDTYYLELDPWGPPDGPYADRSLSVSVPARTYRATAIGATVCLDYHLGALKAPWFQLADCDQAAQ
jgi:FtsH-binding integral membrane protein